MVPEVGIAPTYPRLQRGANLPQLLGVRLRGLHYGAMQIGSPSRSSASEGWSSRQVTLLLFRLSAGCSTFELETSSNWGVTPKRRAGRKVTVGLAAGRMRMGRFGL